MIEKKKKEIKAKRMEEKKKERERLKKEQEERRKNAKNKSKHRVKPTRRKLKEIFNTLDANGNGTLEKAEVLNSVMLGGDLGAYISPKVFIQEFQIALKKSNEKRHKGGHVNFEEFCQIFSVEIPADELNDNQNPTRLLLNEEEAKKVCTYIYIYIYSISISI